MQRLLDDHKGSVCGNSPDGRRPLGKGLGVPYIRLASSSPAFETRKAG